MVHEEMLPTKQTKHPIEPNLPPKAFVAFVCLEGKPLLPNMRVSREIAAPTIRVIREPSCGNSETEGKATGSGERARVASEFQIRG
jgi:hypothetical protein